MSLEVWSHTNKLVLTMWEGCEQIGKIGDGVKEGQACNHKISHRGGSIA